MLCEIFVRNLSLHLAKVSHRISKSLYIYCMKFYFPQHLLTWYILLTPAGYSVYNLLINIIHYPLPEPSY